MQYNRLFAKFKISQARNIIFAGKLVSPKLLQGQSQEDGNLMHALLESVFATFTLTL